MRSELLANLFPFLQWWPDQTRTTARADVIAGLTGAIVVLPQGVAFASIAGMPPAYGLYAAMVPAIIAALYGSSHHLVSGPTTAASIVLFSALSALAEPGSADYVRLALTLSFMVGVIELTMGIARLGLLVNFISHAVVVGFTAGAAILIVLNQVKHFFGVDIPRGLGVHEIVLNFVGRIDEVHPFAVLVGTVTLGVGMAARRSRVLRRLPYMIVALVAGSVTAVVASRLFYVGQEMPGLQVVGALPAALPPLSAPDLSFLTLKELAPPAFAVTLFALTEAISISRSLAARSGQLINGNQEFVGQGLSNIIGSFFSSYVATGSFNRSALNFHAGARTPLAAVLAGLLLVPIVLVVAPWLAYLPNAAMAAILFMVAWSLVDFHHIHKIVRASRSESVVLWSTFIATLLLDLEFAILLGVILSLVVYLTQASRPKVLVRMPDPRLPRRGFNTDSALAECPQVKFVRIDGPLFFGAVNYVAQRLRVMSRRNPGQKHLVLFARSITFVDVAGAEMLAQGARIRRAQGGGLYLHKLKDDARVLLERGGYMDDIGSGNVYEGKSDVIGDIFGRLDRGICVRCTKRIFNECMEIPRVDVAEAELEPPPAATPAQTPKDDPLDDWEDVLHEDERSDVAVASQRPLPST